MINLVIETTLTLLHKYLILINEYIYTNIFYVLL